MTGEKIISKLNKFIRKYYKNKLIKGILYSAFLIFSFFLILNTLEYFNYHSIITRSILFYSYLLIVLGVIYFFIIKPIFKIFKITKTISYKEAADIIGKHFPEVEDKLLNLLQLQELSSYSDSKLLEASIGQKTQELSPIPFLNAVDISKNSRYIKWVLIPLGIIVLSLIFFPSFIKEPTYRYINHEKHFEAPAPFKYKLINKSLRTLQNEDITIRVKIEGDMLVDNVNIVVDKQSFSMRKETKDIFSYTIKQIQKTSVFRFEAIDVISKNYKVSVLPKPILLDLQAIISFPSYTKIKKETYTNISNFSIPKGSTVEWKALTRETKKFIFNFNGNQDILIPNKQGRISFSKTILSDLNYQILTKNDYTTYTDSLQFSISIIPDLSPQIAVIEQRDSIIGERVYFRGQIKDDYGFSKLEFHLEKFGSEGDSIRITKVAIPFSREDNAQEFYFSYDLSTQDLSPGDKAVYYFEVWDNDGIDGAKSTRSKSFIIELPTMEEVDQMQERTTADIKSETNQSIDELKKIKEEIDQLRKKMLEKKDLDWQDKKQIQELRAKQEQIKNKLEEINKKVKDANKLDQKYKKHSEEILNKQKELEKLFQELAKDMYDQIDNMIKENIKKEDLKEALDKIKMNNEDLEKQLDRNLEMFKRLEVEKKLEETIDKLRETAQEQRKLSQETKENPKDNKELKRKQEELNKRFEKIKEDIKDVEKKAKSLEEPQDIKRDKAKEDSISFEQNQAKQNMDKNKNKEASENQDSAADKMEEMASSLEEAQDENQEEQLAEDIQEVRQILKNLIKTSFSQEEIMQEVRKISVTDPSYQILINTQNKIKNDMKMIADSLFAMSKRQPQISHAINKELNAIDNQINNSLEKLLEYNQSIYRSYKNTQSTTFQQYAMTSMNNLALMLAESLDNMQQNMKSKSSNKSNSKGNPKSQCDSPGKPGKRNPKNMRELQDALNKEMERLKKELEGKEKGSSGKPRIGENSQINEELVRMAAKQAMIRQMMKEYAEELKEEGGQSVGDLDKLMRQMEQTETDIVNKIISQQTINRQNNILTRMLEHEKAQKKKEQEQKRESTEGKDIFEEPNKQLLEFNKLKKRELELFKEIPPVFSPYYKEKVNDFFINMKVETKE